MPDQVNPSFIPKQNTAQLTRRNPSRQVFFLALFSYSLVVASLLSVGGLFAYQRYTDRLLAAEIQQYNTEIASFNTTEYQKVVALSEQLGQAKSLLNGRVSMATVLEIIASSTIDTVQFTDAKMARLDNGDVSFEGTARTDSFDSVLFQRRIYDEAARIATVALNDVSISFGTEDDNGQTEVTFAAVFSLNKDELPVTATATTTTPATTTPTVPVVSSSTASTSPDS